MQPNTSVYQGLAQTPAGVVLSHAIRGATVVPVNTAESIYAATRELLGLIVDQNDLDLDQVVSAFFTLTPDLNAAFPAKAARQIGWTHVALICATEIPVPGALGACLRVMVHINTTRPRASYRNIYINGAEQLIADDPVDR